MSAATVARATAPFVDTTRFRVCPDTGFKVDLRAETLIKINAVTAVVFLAIGGVMALLIALTRWQAVHLLSAEWFYLLVTAHGIDMLLVWIIFFEIGLLYFCCTVLLNSRLPTPKLAWLAYGLMIFGALSTNYIVLSGNSSVMFTAYPPMQAHWMFYLGIILFAVGALIGCFIFIAGVIVAKQERTFEGSIPLVTFGALTAAIIAVFSIAAGAIILIPTFLWSIGIISEIDPLMYKLVYWAVGHGTQQVNVSAHVAIWYAIGAIVVGAKPLSEKVSRTAFFVYILFLQLASAHHLLVEPGISSEWKMFNTSYAMYLAVLGSMVHGLTVPGSIELAQRKRGFTKGLFEWLRKAPWGNPAFSGMFLSLVMFGFLGGISGVVLGTEQINILMHNTLYVPGHFHATVVCGTTLAFMALTYLVVPLLFRRELVFPTLARWQPYLFAIGMSMFSVFMMGAGTLGVPRRHWDITFADANFSFEFPSTAHIMLALVGISAVIAFLAGAIFVLVIVGSILFGPKRVPGASARPLVAPSAASAISSVSHGGAATSGLAVPGTFVLTLVFMGAFIAYYFVNWKYLSAVWEMR